MSDTPPIPPGLCGTNGCVLLPPHHDTAHSWEIITTARIYTTDADGVGIRREPDWANVEDLEKAGRKVFITKGDVG